MARIAAKRVSPASSRLVSCGWGQPLAKELTERRLNPAAFNGAASGNALVRFPSHPRIKIIIFSLAPHRQPSNEIPLNAIFSDVVFLKSSGSICDRLGVRYS